MCLCGICPAGNPERSLAPRTYTPSEVEAFAVLLVKYRESTTELVKESTPESVGDKVETRDDFGIPRMLESRKDLALKDISAILSRKRPDWWRDPDLAIGVVKEAGQRKRQRKTQPAKSATPLDFLKYPLDDPGVSPQSLDILLTILEQNWALTSSQTGEWDRITITPLLARAALFKKQKGRPNFARMLMRLIAGVAPHSDPQKVSVWVQKIKALITEGIILRDDYDAVFMDESQTPAKPILALSVIVSNAFAEAA